MITNTMDLKENKNTNKNEERHPWEMARIEIIEKIIVTLDNCNIYKERYILDIGCGDAFLINSIAKKSPNYRCYAIDIAITEVQILELGALYEKIKFFNNYNLLFKEIQGQSIDIVLLLDIIEHIDDVDTFMLSLISNKSFTAFTKFIITVPAFASLFTNHDKFLNHYRRYTVGGLRKLINKYELKELNSGYFFFWLLLPRYIIKITEYLSKKREVKSELVNWNKQRPITLIIKLILLLDFKASQLLKKVGINLPGAVCIYYILKIALFL